MKDVGLAVLKPDFEPEYETGYLSEVFGREGGFTEADLEAEMDAHLLTVQDILRAEHNLGHALDEVKDIEDLHLELTTDKDDHHTGKVYEYGRIDVIKEQEGAHSDNDVTTAGGYMKRNNMDPEAHQKNVRRQQQYAKLIQQLTDQELMQNRINSIMANIERYNRDIKEIEDALEILEEGDLDQNTVQGRANLRAVRATMKQQGLDPNDQRYQSEDGSFNIDQAREDLERARQEKIELRDQEIEKLPESERGTVLRNIAQEDNVLETTIQSSDGSSYTVDVAAKADMENATFVVAASNTNISLDSMEMQQDISLTEENNDDLAALSQESDDFDDMFASFLDEDTKDLFASQEEPQQSEPVMLSTANVDNRSVGSFAASEEDGQTNVITAEFAAVSDPEMAAAQTATPVQTAEQSYTQEYTSKMTI